MRIALVANGFPIVSETFIFTHALGVQAAGHDVTVVTASAHGDAQMFPVHGIPVRVAVATGGLAAAARRLARATRRDRALWDRATRAYGTGKRALRAWLLALPLADFDLIHVEYTGLAVAWLDALTLLAPTKLVVSCRGTAERIKPIVEPARADQLRVLFALVDRVHCVSSDMVRVCGAYGLDPAKAFVNRPAIDPATFARSRPYVARASARLISTGRLHWAKGTEFGVLAAKELVARGRDIDYQIIGAGEDEARVRFAIHDLGLQSRVRLTGRLPPAEIRGALEAADVYVLPSVSEGVSNAALEAMAMAMPVVATAVGGMPEAITDGVDGMLVPSRDPVRMADAIAALLAAPERRVAMGVAARARIERDFPLRRLIDVFVAEYEALVHGPDRR